MHMHPGDLASSVTNVLIRKPKSHLGCIFFALQRFHDALNQDIGNAQRKRWGEGPVM